jgi:maleylpyruvate isomerase
LRTVEALDAASYAAPSLLPGWSRGHVVAHLALNAEGLARALRGVVADEPVAMYAGDEERDRDIDDLVAVAGSDAAVLSSRLRDATGDLAEALAVVPADRLDHVVERTPGSDRTFPVGQVST